MQIARTWNVSPGWRLLLVDAGMSVTNVLRRAGLPDDLFARDKATITTTQYFRFWNAIVEEAGSPEFLMQIGLTMSVEAFDPPVFAATCSPDLNTALKRLAHYKPLIAPMKMHVAVAPETTRIDLEWLFVDEHPPPSMIGMELMFFVQLARIATREKIYPRQVISPVPLEPAKAFREYFGVAWKKGKLPGLVFSGADARRPFLTANEVMWKFFEPELQQRLSKLDASATTAERVQGALLELLPAGEASMEAVARKLGVGERSLQRYLRKEGVTFRKVMNRTRESLARHYLRTSSMTGAEISFLLGFEDPNSFFRAFHTWTGQTPEQVRILEQAAAL